MADQQQQDQQLNIELTEDVADGIYCNLAVAGHTYTEFVLDFITVMPNVPKAKVKSRIILAPVHAKRLMRALVENVKHYEATHGNIKDQEAVNMPLSLGGPTAQA